MDYQFVCAWCTFALVSVIHLHLVTAIVGRDVVLTPKRDLQLRGKSIFYEEDFNAKTTTQNQTILRPWERTLKHVTFVTLFTNAAADAVDGNISKLKAYDDFLHTPYIPQREPTDTRFGDIVTLASGRLEQTGNKTFRFVEGLCSGYDCDAERVWALWQVQKIRHRDTNRKYRYEMKFSVSPLRAESPGSNNGNVKRKAELESHYNNNSKRSVLQTYIQRDDDYPHTFGKIISNNDDVRFAERRFDLFNGGSNFKETTPGVDQYRQATPIPESTFIHGFFQPHPHAQQQHHLPPLPEKLNIGEYIRDYGPKATPKMEHFPHILNAVNRNYYPTPTTYRPIQQTNFPRPELYPPPTSQQHAAMKFPNSQDVGVRGGGANKLGTPVVTHHFHHHFYMPTTTNIENGIGSAEQLLNKPTQAHTSVTSAPTAPNYYQSYYNERMKAGGLQQYTQPQTPKTINFHAKDTEVHRQNLVHVTPVPPLKRPLIYQMYEIPVDSKTPLLIYPAPVVEEETSDSSDNKPFVQSEPIQEAPIRYSEPDPLYLNLAHNPPIELQSHHEIAAPQLEPPKISRYASYAGVHTGVAASRKSTLSNSIAAQLPPHDNEQDVSIPYEDEDAAQEITKPKQDLEQKSSRKELHVTKKKHKIQKVRPSTAAPTTTSPSRGTTTELDEYEETTDKSADTTTFPTAMTTTAELETTNNQLETINTAASSVPTTTTPTTNSLLSATTAIPSTTALDADAQIYKKSSKLNFISTSTAMPSSLRSISRYRLKQVRSSTTTTTEHPTHKWKPRRKHSSNSVERTHKGEESKTQPASTSTTKRSPTTTPPPTTTPQPTATPPPTTTTTSPITTTTTATPTTPTTPTPRINSEQKPKLKFTPKHQRHIKQLASTVAPNSTTASNDSLLLSTNGTEVFEVLTQKSVSKSVSIKIGENGKEIPVILDDSYYGENEVKTHE